MEVAMEIRLVRGVGGRFEAIIDRLGLCRSWWV
jgi:hypothetical protein